MCYATSAYPAPLRPKGWSSGESATMAEARATIRTAPPKRGSLFDRESEQDNRREGVEQRAGAKMDDVARDQKEGKKANGSGWGGGGCRQKKRVARNAGQLVGGGGGGGGGRGRQRRGLTKPRELGSPAA